MLEVAIRGPKLAVFREPAFVHRHHARGRLQGTSGFRRMQADWTNIAVYRKAVAMLAARGELTPRRKRAAVSYIWPVVRNLAKWEIGEAAAAARWVFELDPGFAPQERGSILLGYKMLGFAATERLVRVQASLRRRSGADPA